MKKILSLILSIFMLMSVMSACSDKDADANNTGKASVKETEASTNGDTVLVEMVVKDYGTIKLELYPDIAPITVANFVKLVNQGFYNGLTFHRVIKDFMIQGGDPAGTGAGSGYTDNIKGEFSKNGVANSISHVRGVISMARQGDPNNDAPYYNTAASQFFICRTDDYTTSLDGKYAAFGKVTDGMDVVDAIANVKTNSSDKPVTDVIIDTISIINADTIADTATSATDSITAEVTTTETTTAADTSVTAG